MPLTKAEFDRLMGERASLLAQLEEREKALKRSPECGIGRITGNGYLDIYGGPHAFASDQTRALYEMLKSWYGEATMTEKAKAVIEAAMLRDDMREAGHGGTNDHRIAGEQLEDACSAYRAEQKQ